MTDDHAAAVVVTHLRVRRSKRIVLDGIALQIPRGAITGLLGPSGSGKTTLMRAIVGVQKIEAGAVTVNGETAGSRDLRHRVAYVTQRASVYEDLDVRENLAFYAAVLGASTNTITDVVRTVALEGLERDLVGQLSDGQRARVSLATALLGRPDLLVLDEPTVGLDPVLRRDLWRTFRALADSGTTLLVSSHVMDEARHCDELVLLRDGAVLATGTPGDLITRTHTHDMDAAFLQLVASPRAP
jgi:ABC-2 type transport system ATP-binding protein